MMIPALFPAAARGILFVRRGRAAVAVKRLIGLCALATALAASPGAHADCFDDAGAYQRVNPLILRAIAWQESRNRPNAKHLNDNGSTDYGLMQINSIHLPTLSRYGIGKETLMSPCKNVFIAAWHLRRQMDKYGNTWAAVGAYHSESPSLRDKYAQQIAAILRSWKLMPPGTGPSTSAATQVAKAGKRAAASTQRQSPAKQRDSDRTAAVADNNGAERTGKVAKIASAN
jgi:soluble lytic murein transglycosylase-like protein